MSSSERRYFENRFEDYDGRTSLQSPDGKVRGYILNPGETKSFRFWQ